MSSSSKPASRWAADAPDVSPEEYQVRAMRKYEKASPEDKQKILEENRQKYKQIRFFERKKVEKLLKRSRNALAEFLKAQDDGGNVGAGEKSKLLTTPEEKERTLRADLGEREAELAKLGPKPEGKKEEKAVKRARAALAEFLKGGDSDAEKEDDVGEGASEASLRAELAMHLANLAIKREEKDKHKKLEKLVKRSQNLLAEFLKSQSSSCNVSEELDPEEQEKHLRAELAKHEADLVYVSRYPFYLPYLALFPKEDSEESTKRRQYMRGVVENIVEERRKRYHEDGAAEGAEGTTVLSSDGGAQGGKKGEKGGKKGLGKKGKKGGDGGNKGDGKKGGKGAGKKGEKGTKNAGGKGGGKDGSKDQQTKSGKDETQNHSSEGAGGKALSKRTADPKQADEGAAKRQKKNVGENHDSFVASQAPHRQGTIVVGAGSKVSFSDSE